MNRKQRNNGIIIVWVALALLLAALLGIPYLVKAATAQPVHSGLRLQVEESPSSSMSPNGSGGGTRVDKTTQEETPARQTLQSIKDENALIIVLGDSEVPLYGASRYATWSLVNLVLMLGGMCLGLWLMLSAIAGSLEGFDVWFRDHALERRLAMQKRLRPSRAPLLVLSIFLLGMLSFIIFLVAQNTNHLMVIADKFTLLFFFIAIAQLCLLFPVLESRASNKLKIPPTPPFPE